MADTCHFAHGDADLREANAVSTPQHVNHRHYRTFPRSKGSTPADGMLRPKKAVSLHLANSRGKITVKIVATKTGALKVESKTKIITTTVASNQMKVVRKIESLTKRASVTLTISRL